MNKKFIKEQEEKLKIAKAKIESELSSFAKKNKEQKHDWKTNYPQFGGTNLEDEADEVEEFTNLLPVEHSLELELKKINKAIKSIQKGQYGICEKCKKPISQARLKAYPMAEFCKNCQN